MLSSGGLHPDEAEADDYCWLGVSENSLPCVGLQKHNTSIHSSPFYKQYLYFVLLYHCTLKYEINYYNFYVLPPIYSYGQYKFFALNKVVARPI